jgi:nitroreductase
MVVVKINLLEKEMMEKQVEATSVTGNMQSSTEDVVSLENFFQLVKRRRSIRRYKEFDIPPQDISAMLEAARLAPSAENSQPWRFIVVRDQIMKEIIAEAASGQKFITKANAIIMILGERRASCCPNTTSWHVMDTMIAAEHLVLAATALGYGTCWVAMYETRPHRAIDILKKTLGIPEDSEIIALVTVGLPDESPSARPRNELQDISFDGIYGNAWKEV